VSYSLLVQGSQPLGYWKLNGSGNATVGSNATISSPAWTVPPIVSNSSSAMIVKKSGVSASIVNSYDVFYKNTERNTLQFEFWFTFNGTMNGNGYPGSLSSASQYYVNNTLKIIKIMNGATEIGLVFYDYLRNTFRFRINGSSGSGINNKDAYYVVRNLHTNFYILVGYSNKRLTITVNGEDGVSGYANDTNFPARPPSNINFVIDGSSINLNNYNYVISDLAIYNYLLNRDQQRRRVILGYLPDKPTSITSILESSFFNLEEKDYHVAYHKMIMGDDFNSTKIYENNLIVDINEGIKYKNVPSFYIGDQNSSGSAIITASGLDIVNASTTIQMSKYGEYFSVETSKTITAQVSGVSSASSVIFALTEIIDNQGSLYVSVASSGFYLNFYDNILDTSSNLLYLSTTLDSISKYNFGLCILNENVYMYGNGVTGSTTVSLLNIPFEKSIYIGNLPYVNTNNTLYITNFGMNNTYQTNFSGYDFTDNKMFMARFTNDFSISQVATWITNLPLSHFGSEIVGSKIIWEGMDNCLFQTSIDGSNWKTLLRGEQIPATYNGLNNDILLKAIIPYEYEVENQNQSLNALHISLYRDESFLSMDGSYSLQQYADSASSHSYSIKKNVEPALQRLTKSGIYFDRSSGSTDGYAKIVNTSSLFYPYAIDFWFKADYFTPSVSYILDQATGAPHPKLFFEQSTNHFRYTTGSVYINGNYFADNTFTASTGEYYHIFYNFSGSVDASSALYLNGAYSNTGYHTQGSYSYINLWNNPISSSTALSRYGHFVGNNIQSITDSPVSLWQPIWNNDAITSASGYKIG
jgi:hypothetical protein